LKRACAVLAVLVTLAPASSFAGNLTLRLGGFFPSADGTSCPPNNASCSIFDDASEFYTLEAGFGEVVPPGLKDSDWDGWTFGAAYFAKVANGIELGVSVDGYDKQLDTSYREFLNDDTGSEIFQSLRLTIVPVGVAVRLTPTSRRGITPYLEVGADAIWYKYEEFGEFIDFHAAPGDDDIVADSFLSDGWGYGFHVAGGLKVPINRDFSIVGEGKYQWAEDDMDDDFRLNGIDLGGWSATLGFNIRF